MSDELTTDPKLLKLLESLAGYEMSDEEIAAQRASYARSFMPKGPRATIVQPRTPPAPNEAPQGAPETDWDNDHTEYSPPDEVWIKIVPLVYGSAVEASQCLNTDYPHHYTRKDMSDARIAELARLLDAAVNGVWKHGMLEDARRALQTPDTQEGDTT